MTPQADSSTLDLFRERLASPFIFTFFWVSCTYNWKLIYWFLYEPLKPSMKLIQLPFDWFYLEPLGLTFLIITVVPWVNNLVELLKRYAGNCFNEYLHKRGWKEVVSNDEHLKVLDELSISKSRAHDLTNKYDELLIREKRVKESLIKEREEISKLLNDIASEKLQTSFYKAGQNEIKEKLLEADKLYLNAHNKTIELTKELEKNRNAYRKLVFDNESLNGKMDLIKSETCKLNNVFKLNSLSNITTPTKNELILAIQSLRNIDKILKE
ncbi:hypothetical protein AWH60_03725 [Pseudoalteromonas haloplanktis]|uniref:hypothetical protein n=1 Tax=Pseudoalteromonas sp. S1609 TaxID=579505 RepID=UPI000948C215|nr:hypothetical protein [Pseudoalteromonas sp. S1609]OLF80497.1 hypothetical protein AWH60_03725 [Pseudoalteromonas haloplanktis]TMP68166.1 hypothetical protein CWB76_15630 [Pseudoalteromonas sp. S1609]